MNTPDTPFDALADGADYVWNVEIGPYTGADILVAGVAIAAIIGGARWAFRKVAGSS